MDSGKVAKEHFSDHEKKQSKKKKKFQAPFSSSDKFGPDASMQVKENLRKNIFKKTSNEKQKPRKILKEKEGEKVEKLTSEIKESELKRE